MRFNPAEYETVDERIKKFYEDNECGRIVTELASDPADWSQCRYRAEVYRDYVPGSVPWATGYAYEIAGTQARDGANFGSHEENCETSAIGRALANAGYSGAKRPSRDEMEGAAGKQEKLKAKPKPKADSSETARTRISKEMAVFSAAKSIDLSNMQIAFRDHMRNLFSIDSKDANAQQLGSGWTSFQKSYDTPIDEEPPIG